MAKTKNISLRLDEDDLKLALEATGISKTQKLIDLLLSEFVKPFKPKLIELPKDYMVIKKINIFTPSTRQLEPPELIGMEKMLGIVEIEKQIAAIQSEVKPSIIPKANWERSKQKRISALQNQLK